ncbi:Uncharacterized protein TPAR_06913, partial [Tolypocladium paradoxum]
LTWLAVSLHGVHVNLILTPNHFKYPQRHLHLHESLICLTKATNTMANVTPASLVPETTLQRLAPRREGFWLVAGQHTDHFTLAYVMDGGTHALTYHIYPCNTSEEVYDVCGHLMYDWTGAPDVIPSRFSYNRPLAVPGNQPLELALRPRDQDTQEQAHVPQNLLGTNLNLSSIQDQVAMVQQPAMAAQAHGQMDPAQDGAPQGTQYQLTQSMTHGQDQQQLINSADEHGNIDWSMTNDLFNDITPMVNDQPDNPFAPLSGDSATFASVLNEYSSTAGDMSLLDNDGQMQLEWNLFTDN